MEEKIEVYANDVEYWLNDYITSRNLDRNKISSSQWAAALTYINKNAFGGGDLLRQKNTQNNEPYRMDAISQLVDLYCFLCRDHGQRISVAHFGLLTGISKSTISTWSNSLRRPNDRQAKEIYAKLIENEMVSADDLMLSRSGVNSIAYKNSVEQRYNAYKEKQQDSGILDYDVLAKTLGVEDKLQALPDKGQSADGLLEIKQPWIGVSADADLDR